VHYPACRTGTKNLTQVVRRGNKIKKIWQGLLFRVRKHFEVYLIEIMFEQQAAIKKCCPVGINAGRLLAN
jgi:hypothetical protein